MSTTETHEREARVWHAIDVKCAASAREAIEYALMEAGARGTESSDLEKERVCVSAYFDRPPQREVIRATLRAALHLYDLPPSAADEMHYREVAERDWLSEWKKSWLPIAVGERFVIAPPWSEIEAEDINRIIIRIEPGMAFGTGTHETTRLCLEAIEKYFHGESFLDVGTGTGILAIAAAKLRPHTARIEACDTDDEAVAIARENARLNGVTDKINFRRDTIDSMTLSAACVCANLTADVIVPNLPALVAVTCGRLILSGILATQTEVVQARLRELGIAQPLEIASDGEWTAIIV
jgi:ribosomal protein L11 methyltransferase